MKTVELKVEKGVRNDISLERFAPGDLEVGNNIDVDETGKIWRRMGTNLIAAGSMHSLNAFNKFALVVSGGVLGFITTAGAFTPLVSGIATRVAYAQINEDAFWSDTVQNGIISTAGNRPWGIALPTLPTIATGPGSLLAGTYLLSLTYVRSNGLESGTPAAVSVTVGANSSLVLSNVPVSTDPLVTSKRIYMSTVNGELMYVAAAVPNSTTSLTIAAAAHPNLPCRTLNLGPPPPGQVLGYFNGRAYVGSGRFLWYSHPYEYELFDLTSGFLVFDSNIRTFAPVSTGVFVGTETETMYLEGNDPSTFTRSQAAPYGTVLGTVTYVRNDALLDDNQSGMTPVWMGKTGLCAGFNGGLLKNLTSDRYILPSLTEGASQMKIRSGTPLLVSTLYA